MSCSYDPPWTDRHARRGGWAWTTSSVTGPRRCGPPAGADRRGDPRRLARCVLRRPVRPRPRPAVLPPAGRRGPADPVVARGVRRRRRSVWDQTVVREEMWAHHEPRGAQYMGLNWVGPAIMAYGTDEQKARFLPPIARGEVIWCQGFSEPDAGSDLAALTTRADPVQASGAVLGQAGVGSASEQPARGAAEADRPATPCGWGTRGPGRRRERQRAAGTRCCEADRPATPCGWGTRGPGRRRERQRAAGTRCCEADRHVRI